MNIAFGSVQSNGEVRDSGSGNWSSKQSSKGLYTVTLDAETFDSQHFPVVAALGSPNKNQRRFFTITKTRKSTDGLWFFEVLVRNQNDAKARRGFFFVALAETDIPADRTAIVTRAFDLAVDGPVIKIEVPPGTVTGGGYDIDTSFPHTTPVSSGPLEDASGWRLTYKDGAQAKGWISAVYIAK